MKSNITAQPGRRESTAGKGKAKQMISPCLWFDHQAEEAVHFYVDIFKHSKIIGVTRYGGAGAEASGRPEGSVMTVTFQLEGQEFMALNGGPHFTFTPAISFIVNCETQNELDEFWAKLSDGGEILQCGWVNDKYGVSWQIVPAILGRMMQDKDPTKADRVMQALTRMKKIDIEALKQAYKQ